MVRYAACALLALMAGCAPARQTMPWPSIPEPEPLAPVDAAAASQGGPLAAEPMTETIEARPTVDERDALAAATAPRVVYHEAPPPADVPRDGRRYLVLRWPLPATGVNSLYGVRRDPVDGSSRRHNGVDLEADYGALVETSAAGQVLYAGWNQGHGRMVIIEHLGGYQSSYSHLSQILVQTDGWVVAGQAVGRVGNSGRSTGPHLHFEVTRWGQYVDPLDVLGTPIAVD